MSSLVDKSKSLSVTCIVCNKICLESINIHSGLTRRNGSIRDRISEIVGKQNIAEACLSSDIVCPMCLNLLLNINNLEIELATLKQEFYGVFQKGFQSRKTIQKGRNKLMQEYCIKELVIESSKSITKKEKIVLFSYADELKNTKTNESNLNGADVITVINCDEDTTGKNIDTENVIIRNESNKKKSYSSTKRNNVSLSIIDKNSIDSTSGKNNIFKKYVTLCKDNITNAVSKKSRQKVENMSTLVLNVKDDCDENNVIMTLNTGVSTSDISKTSKFESEVNSSEISHTNWDCVNIEREQSRNKVTKYLLFRNDETDDKFIKKASEIIDISLTEGVRVGIDTPTKHEPIPEELKPVKRRKTLNERKKPASLNDNNKIDYEDDLVSLDDDTKEEGKQEGIKKNQCKICGIVCSSISKLTVHRVRVHSDVYKYVCVQCTDVRYQNKWELTRHCKLRHQVQIHKCPGCEVEESSQNSLDQHIIKEHPESRFFKCEFCGKAFRTYRYLHFVHIKRCHIGLPIKYHCEKCKKGFKDKSSWDHHKLTHSEIKKYPCQFCTRLFRTPYSLKVHVNTHTQEKKYTCQICGMSFLRLCNLIGHKKYVHLRDNRYVCEICGMVIHTRKGFLHHQIFYHTKDKLFDCNECEKYFVKKESLKKNLITQHSQEQPHKCQCGKWYVNGARFRRHVRDSHDLEVAVTSDQQLALEGNLVQECKRTDEDDNEENNVVVITVKEFEPHLYSVEAGPSHNQESLLTSKTSEIYVVNNQMPSMGTLVTSQNVEIPLYHSTFNTVPTKRIGVTSLLIASLNATPVYDTQHIQRGSLGDSGVPLPGRAVIDSGVSLRGGAVVDSGVPLRGGTVIDSGVSLQGGAVLDSGVSHTSAFEETFSQISGEFQTANSFQSSSATLVTTGEHNSLEILQAETSQNTSSVISQVLELPQIHPTGPGSVPVTYITEWQA